MKIAASVVFYNPTKDILKNIDTYVNEVDCLYVYDNSDNDEILSFLKAEPYFFKVKYFNELKNNGIAYALNFCAKQAYSDNYKWLLTMDQDSFFEGNTVKNLLNSILNTSSKVAIMAPVYKMSDFYQNDLDYYVMTSGNLLNLNIWKKTDGFMEELFIDMVDVEYCLRLKSQGYCFEICNTSTLCHELGLIHKKRLFGKMIFYTNHSSTRRFYITRNRYILNLLYKKEFPEFCKNQLKFQKREVIKILLFEKAKIRKILSVIYGRISYLKIRNSLMKNMVV